MAGVENIVERAANAKCVIDGLEEDLAKPAESWNLRKIGVSLRYSNSFANDLYFSQDWANARDYYQRLLVQGTIFINAIEMPNADSPDRKKIEQAVDIFIDAVNHMAFCNERLADVQPDAVTADLYREKADEAVETAWDWSQKFSRDIKSWQNQSNRTFGRIYKAIFLPSEEAKRELHYNTLTLISICEKCEGLLEKATPKERERLVKLIVGSYSNLGAIYTMLAEIYEDSPASPIGTKSLDFSQNLKRARGYFEKASVSLSNYETQPDTELPSYSKLRVITASNHAYTFIREMEHMLHKFKSAEEVNYAYLVQLLNGFVNQAEMVEEVYNLSEKHSKEKEAWSYVRSEVHCRYARMLIVLAQIKGLVLMEAKNAPESYNTAEKTALTQISKVEKHYSSPSEESLYFNLARHLLDTANPVGQDDRQLHAEVTQLLVTIHKN